MWTTAEKLACVERELKYRIRVYERLISQGKMTERQGMREIAIMQAIVEDYRTLRKFELPEMELE